MGKNIIQQARGKGGPTYRAPSFRYKGEARHARVFDQDLTADVLDIVQCQGHSAPLAKVKFSNEEEGLIIAPEGIRVGQQIAMGDAAEPKVGNTLPLKNIQEGMLIHNIELKPGDGGKFVRSGGVFAKIVSKNKNKVIVKLPSKKQKEFNENCRATIGIIAGGGRLEKPILKAGNMHHKMRAKNKLYPIVSGSAQNAVDHPFGNKRTSRKSKAKPTSRNAPPGRKVGMVAARRTGRKKK